MDRFSNKQRHFITVGIILFTVLLTVVVSVSGLNKISRLVYNERAFNLGILMEKITQNFDTAMQSHWDNVTFCENQLMESSETEDSEVLFRLKKTQYWLDSDDTIILIDTENRCLTTDGKSFDWSPAHIPQEKREVFMARINEISGDREQMVFVSRLDKPTMLNGRTFTHIAVSWANDILNEYFLISNYGGKSMSFILKEDGTQIYHQDKANAFSDVTDAYNLIANSKFFYDTTNKKFEDDIKNGRAGCVSIAFNGEAHFAIYRKMTVNKWYALLIAPEKSVGANSMGFMGYLVGYITIIAALILSMLVVLIVFENKRLLRKQEAANAMLRNAADAEHKANQAKTAFLSSMSHDIRTPMNAIIGMTAIAQKHLDDIDRVKECLGKISLAGQHLLTLINDILDISKIESGRMSLNPIVFSLADSTTNMVNVVRPQVRQKNLQFDVRIHKIKHEYIMADELRLNQIFINLLSNAVKYTPEGGIISLDLREDEIPEKPGKIRLTYSIKDNGIGISKEYQKTMYDAFSRANNSSSNKIQGAGLGLAITKQMIDLMHGTIECESEQGKGTKFTVKLDLDLAEKTNRELTLPPLHTLIVDDDEIFLESSSDTLSTMGMVVETTNNGKEAIEKICKRHEAGNDYTLAIIDWKMPDLDGLETTRLIREKVGSDIPIILVSSYDWTEIEEDAKTAGADGFIGKPFFRSSVYYEMKKVLKIEDDNETSDKEEAHDLKDMNILVAEDIDVNWEIIHEWLDMYGIKAERAENGKICCDMLSNAQKGKYDLVLMDIQMPVMDGKEATRQIRASADKKMNSIPIIAMTADAFAEDIEACLEVGMDGHVAKPVDIENLFQEVRRVLKTRSRKN